MKTDKKKNREKQRYDYVSIFTTESTRLLQYSRSCMIVYNSWTLSNPVSAEGWRWMWLSFCHDWDDRLKVSRDQVCLLPLCDATYNGLLVTSFFVAFLYYISLRLSVLRSHFSQKLPARTGWIFACTFIFIWASSASYFDIQLNFNWILNFSNFHQSGWKLTWIILMIYEEPL